MNQGLPTHSLLSSWSTLGTQLLLSALVLFQMNRILSMLFCVPSMLHPSFGTGPEHRLCRAAEGKGREVGARTSWLQIASPFLLDGFCKQWVSRERGCNSFAPSFHQWHWREKAQSSSSLLSYSWKRIGVPNGAPLPAAGWGERSMGEELHCPSYCIYHLM